MREGGGRGRGNGVWGRKENEREDEKGEREKGN